jgi:chromosome segregation ATPase
MHAIQELQSDLHQLDEERRFAVDEAERLRSNLRNREEETSADGKRMASIIEEKDELALELSRVKRDHAKLLSLTQQLEGDTNSREVTLRKEVQEMARRAAEEQTARESLDAMVKSLKDELERSQKQIGQLKARNADQDLEIMQIQKSRTKDQDEKTGLEIALQAKQQELDLVSFRIYGLSYGS